MKNLLKVKNILILIITCVFLYEIIFVQIDPTFYMVSLDVGQGDSTLIITQDKKIILIDPGHGGSDGGAKSKSGTNEKEINLFTLDSLSNINNKDEFNRKGNERLNEIYESRRVHGKDIKKNRKNELDSLGRTHVANGRSEPLLPSSSNVLLLPGREEKQRWLKGKKKTEDAE